ncbi:MAG TPA: class E sortase [Trebonia sp.]|jgi:sortase A|nr:class E sortase [Trebonia sp.]
MGKLRLLAVACIAAGAALVLYTGYRIWDPGARAAQHAMVARLHTEWNKPAAAPSAKPAPVTVRTGEPFATIRIPKFGATWEFAIVEGTSMRQLASGPGHVTTTALPGVLGNFAVAAHDITAGNPFLHLSTLRHGDAVIVQTAATTYHYSVLSENVVRYTDTAVLDPVPDHPNERPATEYITLITCTPVTLDFTPWRVVVTGRLTRTSLGAKR